eukprot:GHVR01089362.1.p1 GENE.GHVR01089362.1~~GHVR01089362.1.p1  ORF type:complete len:130 (-),score=14.02 GHVR01089362.1:166-555(-)
MNPENNDPFLIDWDMFNYTDQCINYLRTSTDNSKENTDVLKAILEASFGFDTQRKVLSGTFNQWVKTTMENILRTYNEKSEPLNLHFLQDYFNNLEDIHIYILYTHMLYTYTNIIYYIYIHTHHLNFNI